MLLDVNQLKKTIRNGIDQGIWVYFDTDSQRAYGKDAPPPPVQISEDIILYTPEEAKRLGLWPPKDTCPNCGKERIECTCEPELCPVCQNPVLKCTCAKPACPKCGQEPCICKGVIVAEGAPAQAFQSIYDQAQDKGIDTLVSLSIHIEGMGSEVVNDLIALGIAVPQMGKADYSINYNLSAEFGEGQNFSATFQGPWDRYKRLKTITDAFAKEASKASAVMNLSIGFQEGLNLQDDQFSMMKEILTTLEVGKIKVNAEPKTEGDGS
jgi:hypothetical protein